MRKISMNASNAIRRLASSVLAVSVITPVMAAVLPGEAVRLLPVESVARAASPSSSDAALAGRDDPGAQLSRAREYLERQRVARQMEEDRERQKTRVEAEGQQPDQRAAQITFTLAKVETDASEILTEAEIKSITDPYTGKTVSLQDLYDMTAAINRLYDRKGYAVCRAYLPPQRIHEGVVQIKLLEGKTGNVTINGLRYTRKGYVANRIRLEPGRVANTDILNEQLQRFNATNDVQLRVLVHAGEKPGTSDYEITALEPKHNQSASLYVDNNGYDTSGRWREGVSYTVRSLTGQRDALLLNYLRSKGTNIFGANYSLPVSNRGTMLDIAYGTNTTEMTDGSPLARQGVEGHSYAAGFTLRHPLRVDEKRRDEIGLQFLHQKSQTDWGTNPKYKRSIIVDDMRNSWIPYISFSHYGKSSVFYHKHSFAFTDYNGGGLNTGKNDHYGTYHLDAIYQKRYGGGQMLSGRFNAQVASEKKKMSSSDMYFIGGSSSVRGYEESFLSGSQGFNASLSWMVPLDKKRNFNAFTFLDYGRVFGGPDTQASLDNTLFSTGLGVTAGYKNFFSSLTLGIPLKREFKSQKEKVDKTRIHFNCSLSF